MVILFVNIPCVASNPQTNMDPSVIPVPLTSNQFHIGGEARTSYSV